MSPANLYLNETASAGPKSQLSVLAGDEAGAAGVVIASTGPCPATYFRVMHDSADNDLSSFADDKCVLTGY